MNATHEAVARLEAECRRLREELDRVTAERDRLDRALFVCHQLSQESYEGWRSEAHQSRLLRQRLADEALWHRTGEAAQEFGHTIKAYPTDPA